MVFSTAVDNQPLVTIHVLQGEREMSDDNMSLGRFELVGIPPAPRGVPQIEVSFDIDASGLVNVSARDLGTGKKQSIRIVSSSGLSEDAIDTMINEADDYREADRKARQMAELRNNADGLIYTTDKAIDECARPHHRRRRADPAGPEQPAPRVVPRGLRWPEAGGAATRALEPQDRRRDVR